jgi:hypothetical protein
MNLSIFLLQLKFLFPLELDTLTLQFQEIFHTVERAPRSRKLLFAAIN